MALLKLRVSTIAQLHHDAFCVKLYDQPVEVRAVQTEVKRYSSQQTDFIPADTTMRNYEPWPKDGVYRQVRFFKRLVILGECQPVSLSDRNEGAYILVICSIFRNQLLADQHSLPIINRWAITSMHVLSWRRLRRGKHWYHVINGRRYWKASPAALKRCRRLKIGILV